MAITTILLVAVTAAWLADNDLLIESRTARVLRPFGSAS